MTALLIDPMRMEAIRFRDDDAELFGVEVGEGPCDQAYKQGLRDHLSHAVEVVPSLFPEIAQIITDVQNTLLPGDGCRAFISSSPAPQAYCMAGREEHTMIVGITSGLIALLTPGELRFVIGHELGHYLMGHHRRVPPSDAAIESLGFRSLQRMAEISADRVGFLVCPSSELAFRAIMKTASGVGAPHLRFDYGAFSDQLRKLRKLGGGSGNAHATHPLFTVRCRALSLFEMSESFHGITRSTRRWAISTADMDEKIATDLAESTGYHPIAEMENSVRRALIWLMLRLFIEDGRFSKPEQAFLRENFDAETAESAIAFVRDHGPVAVVKKYGEALDSLAEMNDAARSSVCAVIRRVASVASGAEAQRLSLLGEMHRKLRCDRSPGIEPWDDENDLGSLIDIR